MPTDAARNFSDMLDAVEHRGERFAIVRSAKVVALLDPVGAGKGREVKAVLRTYQADADFARDLSSVREMLRTEDRS